MEEEPIQLSNDELGCPRCKTQLVEGRSPFYFQRVKVGSFDSLRCEFCGFFVLTKTGFRESSKAIIKLGIVEPIGEDFTGIMDSAIELFYPNRSENHSMSISIQDKEQETLANSGVLVQHNPTVTPLLLISKFRFPKK